MVAPRVIDIFRDHHARVIENVRDVPLRVLAVQIVLIVALHAAQAVAVIDELQRVRPVAQTFLRNICGRIHIVPHYFRLSRGLRNSDCVFIPVTTKKRKAQPSASFCFF